MPALFMNFRVISRGLCEGTELSLEIAMGLKWRQIPTVNLVYIFLHFRLILICKTLKLHFVH